VPKVAKVEPRQARKKAERRGRAGATEPRSQKAGLEPLRHLPADAAGEGPTARAGRERLQKVLARAGIASRRHAEDLIRDGRVRVAGEVVTRQGLQVDPARDLIEVDGRRVTAEPLAYVLFHKPRAVVSTMSDPAGRPAVADFMADVGSRVVPVGRLDFHTSGVMLLTNDGELSRGLLHPSSGVTKEYVLKVKGEVDDDGLARLRRSIEIDGRKTRPARVERARSDRDNTWLEVVLHEGKNRQVRRLAEHAGYRVMRLTRRSFAGLTVLGLAPGEWRHLTPGELEALRTAVDEPLPR
jgi:23S rRNA pseudouridine2605 synthase